MDVNALRKVEIHYELQTRGWSAVEVSSKTLDELRKTLRGHYAAERGNRSICEINNEIPFDVDAEQLFDSVTDITKVLEDADKPLTEALRRRLGSRMAHVANRFKNLNHDRENSDHQRKIANIRQGILIIEGNLAEDAPMGSVEPAFDAFQNSLVASSSILPRQNAVPYPIFKWNIHYDGSCEEDDLMQFLEQIEELCLARGVSHEMLFTSALDLFEGPARVWYSANRHLVSNWPELVDLLKRRFLPANYDREIRAQLDKVWQQEGENVSLFVARVNRLYSRLTMPVLEAEKVAHVRERLVPFFLEHTALIKFDSLQSLEDKCAELERTRICVQRRAQAFSACATTTVKSTSHSATFPRPHTTFNKSVAAKTVNPAAKIVNTVSEKQPSSATTSSSTANALSKVVCYNCKQLGHYRSSCPKPFRRCCFRCGRQGVTIRTCTNCPALPSNDGDGK